MKFKDMICLDKGLAVIHFHVYIDRIDMTLVGFHCSGNVQDDFRALPKGKKVVPLCKSLISGSSFRISVMELTNTLCNFQGWATSGFN